MRNMHFAEAIDDALAAAMAQDGRIVLIGEDVRLMHNSLFLRFGAKRVRETPISESAFLGAGIAAAMAGLRPVVEIQMADFLMVAVDALLNHAAKLDALSGGKWQAPVVVRAPCGGGYGDGGQHEQTLWGWLAHVPGLAVLVPSNPADAGGLMLSALSSNGPVVFMEHKLLSVTWREALGSGGRKTVEFDVPARGARGPVPNAWKPLPLGQAELLREGSDLTLVGLGVSVHRALQAAELLKRQGVQAEVIDLRTVAPLDRELFVASARKTGRVLVVDEDYAGFGLSGELAAVLLEAGLAPKYARVCTQETIPYARKLEEQTLPNTARIMEAAKHLLGRLGRQ
jgi:pyruvate/2-oxoglutarate/acetoin dehydrogenase E1 component